MADLYYGLGADDLAATAVEVVNSSGTPGLARRAAARLEEIGFRGVKVRTASDQTDVTTVISRMQKPNAARLVAAALGRAVLKHEPGRPGAPITVVIARDAVGRAQGTVLRRDGSQ
jgi:hypothetical protein